MASPRRSRGSRMYQTLGVAGVWGSAATSPNGAAPPRKAASTGRWAAATSSASGANSRNSAAVNGASNR
eukprot:11154356-Lingulodinium_polyedra.AAC.1